jgi:hypothetical protein
MPFQKNQSAFSNKVHVQAKLYRLMSEVRALRDRAGSLEARCEAKTSDRTARNPNRWRESTIEKYHK